MFYYKINGKEIDRFNLNNLNNKIYYYNAGEIFEPTLTIQEIYHKVKDKKINDFLGEYNYFFEDKDNIYIISDELGAIKWFYYKQDDVFVISNNLWYMAHELNLGIESINKDSFYESILFYFPLNNKTYFQDINVVPQGSLVVFSKKNKTLHVEKIKHIKYKEKNLSKEEWFYCIDNAFKKNMDNIQKFNSNLYLGISISGGLDSRFSLLYTKHIKNKIGFLLGIRGKIFKPLDLISAQKLSNYFKIKLKLVNPFKNIDIKTKFLIDISRNPIGPSNFLKAIDKHKSFSKEEEFNVLLTGSYGGLVGGRILNDDLINSNNEDLTFKMFYFYSEFTKLNEVKKGNAYFNFIKKSFYKLFLHLNLIDKKKIDFKKEIVDFLNDNFLIPISYKEKLFNKFDKLFNKKLDNLSKIMTFHLYRHSIRGSFESLHGQVKAYSIYYPYIFELSKQWNVEYLKGRTLIEEFIIYKDKEISKIALQTFNLPKNINYNKYIKFLLKIISFISFSLRGLVITYNKWWKRKDVQKFVKQIMKEDVKVFNEIFNEKDIEHMMKYKRYDLLLEQILKLKYILKVIENKNYNELLNLKISESSKY